MLTRSYPFVAFACASLLVMLTPISSSMAAEPVDFAMQVQPLLSKYCYACHGPDQQKSGLRLDVREDALKPADSDERAIVPGDALGSRLMKVIDGRDEEFAMPPKGAKPTPQQVELIQRWINEGAKYNKHWSFVAPQRPELPKVTNPQWRDWPRNAIDHFILNRLEREGLSPSPQADPHTLIRRVYLDLIGLPPTPEEADAFAREIADHRKSERSSPDPYERLVDRLLASPHYGERWARRWLDLARYSDTNGYEKDRTRSIWPYRDWVINAINDDMPFDQFTIAQIAGDILAAQEHPKSEIQNPKHSLIATGFHRNTMVNEEGGIDVEEFRYHAVADRVSTTSAVWLGLTVGCAQCHTHKYDPITHTEYFSLFAFLNNADEPEYELVTQDIQRKRDEITANILKMEAALEDQFSPTDAQPIDWTPLEPVKASAASGRTMKIAPDRSVHAQPAGSDKDTYTITATTDATDIIAIKLEALPDDGIPGGGPGLTPHGNFVLSELSITASPSDQPKAHQPVTISSAEADVSQNNFNITQAIDGNPATGWAIDDGSGKINKTATALFHLDRAIGHKSGTQFIVTLNQSHGSSHLLGRFRLSVGTRKQPAGLAANEATRRQHPDRELQKWIDAQRPAVRQWRTLTPSTITSTKGGTFNPMPDGSVLVTGDNPNQNIYTIEAQIPDQPITAIRLEVLPDESLPNGGPGRAPLFSDGDFHLGEFQASLTSADAATPPQPLTFREASHSYAQQGRSAQNAIDGDLDTAWSIKGATGKAHQAVFVLKDAVQTGQGGKLIITLDQRYIHQMTIGRFRLAVTGDKLPVKASALPSEIESVLAADAAQWSEKDRAAVRRHFLLTTPVLAKQQQAIASLRSSMPRGQRTLVMQERLPQHARTTRLHKRGEFLQPAQVVKPGVLSVLHPLNVPAEKATRLDFARWLVDPKNPLVGRVAMNRQWEAFFGRGLVFTSEDFGLQGDKPSHPDLLDWLAVEFFNPTPDTQNPRPVSLSMKQMHKLIVMSATYRQSSHVSPQLLERDPTNVLLARGPRLRMEAEKLRDSALLSSGLLSRRIGGPSVFPPQPAGVTNLGYGGFNWPTATGENRYRRGLYTFAKRTTPFAAFVTFDGPTGETCLVRRGRSNNPLQALTMMNDPVFVEASQALALRVLSEKEQGDEARIDRMFRLVLVRPPTEQERAALVEFMNLQRQRLNKGELDAAKIAGQSPKNANVKELAAWTVLARSVMNLDEAVTKE